MRLAALCRCGRCGGPRRWSFSAGARAGPPVARSARHASMLLALPDRGSPWEPSRDCLPGEIMGEIAEERVAGGVRVGGWRRQRGGQRRRQHRRQPTWEPCEPHRVAAAHSAPSRALNVFSNLG